MLTTHNQPSKARGYVEGIEVIYLPVEYNNLMGFSQRAKAFLKYMILAAIESTKYRGIDLCYVMTTPLSTGIVAWFNKLFLGRPYIFEVGDLWPKVPIEMGLLRGKWKQKLLIWLEGIFYRNARGLVGLSEPITRHLQQIAPKVPVETVFNISDCEWFVPAKKEIIWIEKYKVQKQFVITYTGTFGLANCLSQVIDLAKEVRDLPIKFILVGEGAEKEKISALVQQNDSKNIQVYDSMTKSQLLEVVNITDAMLVSFAPYDSLHTGSPNKFFDALAAGKLVITNFGGWIGDLISDEQCGFYAEKPSSFRKQIQEFLNSPELLQVYQSNARRLAEERFDLSMQAKKQQEFMTQLFS